MNLKYLYITGSILTAFIISSCCSSDNARQSDAIVNLTLPGWVNVDFGIDELYIHANKAKLDETYDEFVGALLDDGLSIKNSKWLKPAYGNENLIMTLDSDLASQKILSLENSKHEFDSSGYKFNSGEFNLNSSKWRYSGYSVAATNSELASFKSYVFLCGKNKGVSVFYWGTSNIDSPKDNQSIMQLLEFLSVNC